MAKVSYIISAQNQTRLLAKTIESVIAQELLDIDFTVINDTSSKKVYDIAKVYQYNPNYKIITPEPVTLNPNNRNLGLKEVSGQYLCFLNPGCVLDQKHAEKLCDLLDAEQEASFAYCDTAFLDDKDKLSPGYQSGQVRTTLSGDISQSLLLGQYFPIQAVMIRRSVFEKEGGFNSQLTEIEDYELLLRLSLNGYKAAFLDEILAYQVQPVPFFSKSSPTKTEANIQALEILTEQHPQIIANTLNKLQETISELQTGNQWFKNKFENLYMSDRNLDTDNQDILKFNFIENFNRARISSSPPGQAAIREISVNGVPSRQIFLHPPSTLEFTLPTGLPGQLHFAVCMHPEVWNNPNSGECLFKVYINESLEFSIKVDPAHKPTDQQWHEFVIDVPKKWFGDHTIVLETQGIGSHNFRWALWRSPIFFWNL